MLAAAGKSKDSVVLRALLFIGCGFATAAYGEQLWVDLPLQASERNVIAQVERVPDNYRVVRFDVAALKDLLDSAEARGEQSLVELSLPMPDGAAAVFRVQRSSVMPEQLKQKFPGIQAFEGYAVDAPATSLRLEVTPRGVSAQVLAAGQRWMIDPRLDTSPDVSISYFSRDLSRNAAEPFCELESPPPVRGGDPFSVKKLQGGSTAARSSGTVLRTYRIAVATTGQYGQFHGGTVPLALAAVVTTINRVDGIYEKEMAISLELVGNNDDIIYVDSASHPFTTNSSAGTLINESQTEIDNTIGSGNYDIGHTFSTGAGGLAGLGVVCTAGEKARGVTGRGTPLGDAYDVDYVAHEIGHQFGGNHTFNGTVNACSGANRNASTAYEPGSGSTIQAYAGICGSDNLQGNSDPIFHSESFNEMYGYASEGGGASCAVSTATGNAVPVVNAGLDYTVPASTPLVLSGTATDSDGDILSYLWEQRDLGPQAALAAPDDGQIPLFRVLQPVSEPTRYLPPLDSVVAGISSDQERLPAVSRDMVMRLTARDGAGGVSSEDVTITVDGTKGPFLLQTPNGGETLGAYATVDWDVAGTADVPVSVSDVEFYLSTDSGASFSVAPFATKANLGSTTLMFPSGISTNTARLMIKGVGNIFYDVSDADFEFDSGQLPPPEPVLLALLPSNSGAELYYAQGADNGTSIASHAAMCSPQATSTTTTYSTSPDSVIDGSAVVTSTLSFDTSLIIPEDGPSIEVNIAHSWRGDLVIDVESPSGTVVRLKNYNYGDSNSDVDGIYPETILPAESLSAFAGENALGTWILRVSDVEPTFDDGVLEGWGVAATIVVTGETVASTGTTSPLVFTGMDNGENYLCTMTSQGVALSSPTVAAGSVTPSAVSNPPGQPTITQVEGADGGFVVTIVPGAGPVPDAYRVVCGDRDNVTISNSTTISGLEDGSSYTCYAIASSGGESSEPSVGVTGEAGEAAQGLPIWLLYEATQ